MESISVKGLADLYINFSSGMPYVIQLSLKEFTYSMESISVKGLADLYINFSSGMPYVIQLSLKEFT